MLFDSLLEMMEMMVMMKKRKMTTSKKMSTTWLENEDMFSSFLINDKKGENI